MKTKIVHPLWTHLPAVIALIIMVLYALVPGPLPANAPVHYGSNGVPDDYGSPWWVFGLVTGLSILFILISGFIDELWARQEKKKAFNWLSLMDEVTVGAMVGINLGYFAIVRDEGSLFSFPWGLLGLVGGGATILGVLLEMIRPYRPYSVTPASEDSKALKAEIGQYLKNNTSFVYWDYQNPLYVSLVTIGLPLVFIASGVLVWFDQSWLSIIFFLIAIQSTILYGGQRVLVTRGEITIKWGILGIKVLRLRVEEITQVEKHEFAPIKDFGGYGIRFNREMKAYFLRGNRGVKITTSDRKKYLIGSDNVDRLEAVINAVSTGR